MGNRFRVERNNFDPPNQTSTRVTVSTTPAYYHDITHNAFITPSTGTKSTTLSATTLAREIARKSTESWNFNFTTELDEMGHPKKQRFAMQLTITTVPETNPPTRAPTVPKGTPEPVATKEAVMIG